MDSLPKSMDNTTDLKPEGFEGQKLYRVPPAVLKRMRQRPHLKDFLVTDLGYFPVTHGHKVERKEASSNHILILVEGGSGWLEIDGRTWSAHRGQAILVPSSHSHSYGASGKDPWRIYWFHFTGHGATELLKWTPFSQKSPVIPCPASDSLRRHFRTALATVERGYSDHSLLELSRVLINVLSLLHARNPSSFKDRQGQRIEQVMDYMRENVERPETLSNYAERCGFSVSRFSETFKKHCGVSPMVYLTELRIQRACQLLDTTDLHVGEIADQLGFHDNLYFSRLFRKHAGMPPTQYRKLKIG